MELPQAARQVEEHLLALARLEVADASHDEVLRRESPTLTKPEPFGIRCLDGDDRVPDHVDARRIDPLDGDRVVGGRLGVGDDGIDPPHRDAPGNLPIPGPCPVDIDGRSAAGQEHGHPGQGPEHAGEGVGRHEPCIDEVDAPGEAAVLAERTGSVADGMPSQCPKRLAPQPEHVDREPESLRLRGKKASLRQEDEADAEVCPGKRSRQEQHLAFGPARMEGRRQERDSQWPTHRAALTCGA